MACVVEGCKSHSTRKENTNELVTFHRFPKDEAAKAIWVRSISRHNWAPKKHSHICSKHFTVDSFIPNENAKYRRRRLRKINTLTKRNSRNTKKNSQLYDILMDKLKQENIELEHVALLDAINENEIIKRLLQKQEGKTLSRECSLELKKFAVTLHYLSPRAYTFIRDQAIYYLKK